MDDVHRELRHRRAEAQSHARAAAIWRQGLPAFPRNKAVQYPLLPSELCAAFVEQLVDLHPVVR